MKSLLSMLKDQKGSSLVLVGIAMAGLLAMTGLVVDLGSVFVAKTQLQKAANAAALSAAQELTYSEAAVRSIITEVLVSHRELDSFQDQHIVMNKQVTVLLDRAVPLVFSSLFGVGEKNVEVKATAELANMGRASGVAPLGIDDSIQLEYGVPYSLKVDQTESDTGNFGILALGGPGANTYEQNLKYGYQSEIGIGDILETQTGNIVGKTQTGVQERIQSCPYPIEEVYHRDCKRVILIPVYKEYSRQSNQLKSVEVTGFAYFYITEPVDNHDKTVKGIFIKRAGTGYTDPDAEDNGAYTIRLTE